MVCAAPHLPLLGSADLADQLERLLTDNALHRELSNNTRSIAANFTVEK